MQGLDIAKTSELDDWRNIFECWFDELEKVVELCEGNDAPYVHAEHESTHHFGVSASKAGLGTVRELIGTRNGGNARLDLCLVSENSLDIVEAKWIEFDCSKKIPYNSIVSGMDNACNDASSYENIHSLFHSKEKTYRRSGIFFISPYFKGEINMSKIDALINYLSSELKYDVLAWSFPIKARKLKYWGRTYPGTVAVVRCNEN